MADVEDFIAADLKGAMQRHYPIADGVAAELSEALVKHLKRAGLSMDVLERLLRHRQNLDAAAVPAPRARTRGAVGSANV